MEGGAGGGVGGGATAARPGMVGGSPLFLLFMKRCLHARQAARRLALALPGEGGRVVGGPRPPRMPPRKRYESRRGREARQRDWRRCEWYTEYLAEPLVEGGLRAQEFERVFRVPFGPEEEVGSVGRVPPL